MPSSPEQLLCLSPATLRALLSTFGAPPSLSAKATHRDIARALFSSRAPARLEAVLSTAIARFSSPRGRLALVEAARATGDSRAEAWLDAPAGDVAANLAIERATSKGSVRRAATRLFALAAHRVERDLPEQPTYELVAETPVSRDPESVLPLLKRALGARLIELWHATDVDGALRVAVFLRQPAESRVLVDDSGRFAPRCDASVVVDLVRISAEGDRVAVTTAMVELLPLYASALSLSLQPSITLRPLHDLTHEQLAALAVPRVARVDVVALRFRRPHGARVEVRGPDALDPSLHPPRTGYVDRATIRVTVDAARKVDAFLQLPHRVEISDPAFAAPVRAVLDALAIFAPGRLPDDAPSLAPYEHGDWRWRAVLPGVGFELLVRGGLLVRAVSAHVATHEHRMHGAAYVVRDVPGETDAQYALAEDRSLGARLVGPEDRVVWRLDLGALAACMMRDLGAGPADVPIAVPGILDLGVVSLPSGKLRVVYPMAAPSAGWVEAVRRACGLSMTPVVLFPRGHAGDAAGMLAIELDVPEQLGAKRIGRALGRIAEALGVPHEVEKWRQCDEDLVVDAATQSAWVTGVRAPLKERPFGLVHHLAKHPGKLIATKDAGKSISAAGSPDVTARKAKLEAEKQIREALDAAGVDSGIVDRMILVEGKKGYRLGVTARVM